MPIRPDMIGIVVPDLPAALQFYRLLGLPISAADAESHVDVTTSNGDHIAWDTEALMRSIYPDWGTSVGQRVTIA